MKRYALQSLCSSRSLISVFCALYAWTAGGALAASAPEDEAVLEARAAQAEKVLADRSFYERWKEPSAIDSVKTAAQVKSDAEGVLKQIEEALAVQRSWCGKKFFVNSCIDDARRASFDREREVREIIVAADEIIRLDRVEKMRAEQEKNALEPRREPMKIAPKTVKTDPPEPMRITPKSVKAPSQPIDIAPKTVKEPSAPVEWEKKTVKDASVPHGMNGKTVKDVAAPTPIPGSEMPHDAASEPQPKRPTRPTTRKNSSKLKSAWKKPQSSQPSAKRIVRPSSSSSKGAWMSAKLRKSAMRPIRRNAKAT